MISLFVYISVLWRIWSKSLLTSLERGEFLFPNLAWKPTNMLTFARKLHIISFALLNVINSLINLLHFINVWKMQFSSIWRWSKWKICTVDFELKTFNVDHLKHPYSLILNIQCLPQCDVAFRHNKQCLY